MATNRTRSHRLGPVPRTVLATVLLLLTACEATLDPRRLERVHLGMARADVALQLEMQPEPWLRWFSRSGGDWLVERCDADHPHPRYCLGYVDGKLVGVLTDGRLPTGFDWDSGRRGYTGSAISMLGEAFTRRCVPLAWADLEPIDALECREGMSEAAKTALTALAMPPTWLGLVVVPIAYPIYLAFTADPREQRARLVAALHALPAQADRSTVEEALGSPAVRGFHVRDGRIEIWAYDAFHGQESSIGARLAFRDGRLLWIEFGYYLRTDSDGRYLPPSLETASAISATP